MKNCSAALPSLCERRGSAALQVRDENDMQLGCGSWPKASSPGPGRSRRRRRRCLAVATQWDSCASRSLRRYCQARLAEGHGLLALAWRTSPSASRAQVAFAKFEPHETKCIFCPVQNPEQSRRLCCGATVHWEAFMAGLRFRLNHIADLADAACMQMLQVSH